MTDDDVDIIGADPLVDGMTLSVRIRRDFTVTDADRLLAAARRCYAELNPGASAAETAEVVSGAADALFVILEHAGLSGATVDERLAGHAVHGLAVEGHREQIVINEPDPLSPHPRGNCLRGDVFALPPHGHHG